MSLASNIIFVVAIVILGVGGYFGNFYADVGAGYTAKVACSGVFLAKRSLSQVEEEDLAFIAVPVFSLKTGANSVTSSTLFGLYSRTAFFDPVSKTCSLVGHTSSGLRHSKPSSVPSNPKPFELKESKTSIGEDKLENLKTIVEAVFHEPFVKEAGFNRRTRGIVVLYDGKIIAEEYGSGVSSSTPLAGWGLTEALFASVIGQRVKEGKLQLTSSNLFSEWERDFRRNITINDLLRGTSGLTLDHSNHYSMLYLSDSVAEYAITHAHDKHSDVVHFPGAANILSRVLRNSFTSQEAYWEYVRAFLDQIGLVDTVIETDAVGDFVASSFGFGTARDWARFALFLSQKGSWNGEQVLPANWVDNLVKSNGKPQGGLWSNAGKKLYKSLPEDAFFALGDEEQSITVIPSRKLAVVRLGCTQPRTAWHLEGFLDYLLQNVIP